MTRAMTVRLDEETDRMLDELTAGRRSRSAAVQDAIRQAWDRLQEDRLAAAYEAAIADNPHYPYESAQEAQVMRARRRRRAERSE